MLSKKLFFSKYKQYIKKRAKKLKQVYTLQRTYAHYAMWHQSQPYPVKWTCATYTETVNTLTLQQSNSLDQNSHWHHLR